MFFKQIFDRSIFVYLEQLVDYILQLLSVLTKHLHIKRCVRRDSQLLFSDMSDVINGINKYLTVWTFITFLLFFIVCQVARCT